MTDTPDTDGVIDAIVSEECFYKQQYILGEVLTFEKYTDPDGNPLKIRIAGVFNEASAKDEYWSYPLSKYNTVVFIDFDLLNRYFMYPGSKMSVEAHMYAQYDYSGLKIADVDRILKVTEDYNAYFESVNSQSPEEYYTGILNDFKKTAKKVRTTFLVLQVPIYVLLAAFIFMVSRQMLDMEEGEIAVLKSRGSSRFQLIGVYLLQSIITSGISLAIGIPLAVFLVRVLGATNAFLEFISRKALDVQIGSTAILYALIAAVFSITTMVLPVLKYSKVTIVNHKQTKHRGGNQPLWQKFFLDILLLGVSLYGLYSFNNQKALLADRVLEGESLDPLLFLSASLFMLGAGLFALRILPFIVKLIFTLFKKHWSPALYTSFVRVIRTRKQQSFIMVFLVMTIAIGVFDASAARTINMNDEQNLRYMSGADIVLKEKWADNSSLIAEAKSSIGASDIPDFEYKEPDFSRFQQLEGIDRVTKVLNESSATVSLSSGSLKNVQVMGIHTKQFGEIANFDTKLLPEHWYHYLNAMSQNSRAVLVSSNFRDEYDFKLSDIIYYKAEGTPMSGIIYGFIDYFPGYAASTLKKGTDGKYTETDNYLIVANLSEIQSNCGVTPYEVWIKPTGSSQFIYDYISETNLKYTEFRDLSADLVKHKNDASLQGTNGILTVGFIAVLLMCTVGFLIYWILSIRSRELQFGIFRAMGMSMREIYTMLINEHLWISGASILAGAFVGKLTAKLFMPLIQIAYSSADNAIPLKVISDPSDDLRLTVIIGIMIAVCLMILGWLIRRMKIAQALKLGED